MPIEVIRHISNDSPVDDNLLIETLERNRERIRTIANMSLTVSGIMISSSIAFVLFAEEKGIGGPLLSAVFGLAMVLFFIAASLSLISSTLRRSYVISTRSQFIVDLLSLYYSELRFLRVSFVPLFIGFLTITAGMIAFLLKR